MIFDWKINLEEFFSLWVEDATLLIVTDSKQQPLS